MVRRDGLRRIITKYGCHEKFITIVKQFHDDMHARVQDSGEGSVAFPITNGVKQGCFLASTLFSIMFSAMLFNAFSGSDIGILSLTSEGFKERPRRKMISSTSFCSPTIVYWTLLPKPTYKKMLTSSQWPVTILASLPIIYTIFHAIRTSLGRSFCPHERSPPPKETALQRTISGQALPRRAEKVFQRHTEGLHEIFRYRP